MHAGSTVHAVLQNWNMARWRREPFALERFKTLTVCKAQRSEDTRWFARCSFLLTAGRESLVEMAKPSGWRVGGPAITTVRIDQQVSWPGCFNF
jgi:hypothetical protein